jgi:protein-S-isoprenylcysteine O-methyltransferase Ste14
MRALELKIPPLVLMLVMTIAMWALGNAVPTLAYDAQWSAPAALLIGCIGAVICFMGVAGFRHRRTTVDPIRPQKSSVLVVDGIYRHSRNPMYTGMAMMLAAWALYLQNFAAIVLWPAAPLYLQRFQILPEERALTALFGAEYQAYRKRVRRWL